jgi:hypothetical protein
MATQGRQIVGLDLIRCAAACMIMLFPLSDAETAAAGAFLRGRGQILRLVPGIA